MLARPDRVIVIAQAVICALMLGAAAFGGFPSPVPVLYIAGALGAANAAFDLMRTFGSALLGGVAASSIALAGIPFVTCSSARFSTVLDCTGNSPTWHLTGTVIAAGLSGASLVLARTAARNQETDRLTGIERRLADLQRDLGSTRRSAPRQTQETRYNEARHDSRYDDARYRDARYEDGRYADGRYEDGRYEQESRHNTVPAADEPPDR
jgi:hypothetical protein